MRTKNKYQYPVDKEYIQEVITTESPAHIVFRDKDIKWDLTKSIDFICKEGTPIKSSKEGIVFETKDNVTENYKGFREPSEKELPQKKQDGNYVVIEHGNNEFSFYGHLEHKQVKVKKGKKVTSGQIIGYSGDTGWSIEPHLHFMVFNFLDRKAGSSKGLTTLEINWK